MKKIDSVMSVIHESTEALHLNRFSVTPVNYWWVITERTAPDDVQYWTKRDTQQDAINEVLRMLNVEDDIDAWNQPHPAQDLLERIMAAYDSGETDWCCERVAQPRGTGRTHARNCLLDEARKLCGPGD